MAVIGPVFKRILAAGVLLLMAACGGSGGGGTSPGTPSADTMTVTVWSQATGTATTTYVADGAATLTVGTVANSGTAAQLNSPTVQVTVSADGVTAGTYPITGDLTKLSVRYVLYQSPTTTIIFGTNGSGTIILTSVGAVGQQITGSFNADVFMSPVPMASYLTNTLNVSGTFSVKRWF